MTKFITAALVAAAVLTAASAANAGYWTQGLYGPIYVPTCGFTPWGYVCG
jgi:hypothetical protein